MAHRAATRWNVRYRSAYYVIAGLFLVAAVIQILDLITRWRHHDSIIQVVCALVISIAVAAFVAAGARRAG